MITLECWSITSNNQCQKLAADCMLMVHFVVHWSFVVPLQLPCYTFVVSATIILFSDRKQQNIFRETLFLVESWTFLNACFRMCSCDQREEWHSVFAFLSKMHHKFQQLSMNLPFNSNVKSKISVYYWNKKLRWKVRTKEYVTHL